MATNPRSRRLRQFRRRYPSLFPYGDRAPVQLSAAAERTAPFAARLESAWAILVRIALRSWSIYTEREKACVGIEDAMQAVVCELIARDRSFDPNRGRYVTFAKTVVRQSIAEQRRRARVVTAPAFPYTTIREYTELAARGELSPAKGQTLERVRRVVADQPSLPSRHLPVSADDTVLEPVIRAEERATQRAALVSVFQGLEPIEAHVLAREQGGFGMEGLPRDARSIARCVPGVGAREIDQIAQAALGKAARTVTGLRRRRSDAEGPIDGLSDGSSAHGRDSAGGGRT